MIAFELIDLLDGVYESQYIIEFINELIGEIESNPKKLAIQLSNEIEDFALDHCKCPLCGNGLIVNEHTEDRGEYQGVKCREVMYTRECSNAECSYIGE